MVENNPKISVIMPSYNVVDYVDECISSVINQTLDDIEIICIDAGSDDGTLDILEKYSNKDSRIKVLLSDKKSYGYQVNMGLSEANGEYISIIETDDFIVDNMFELLYKFSNNNIDIIKGNFYHYDDNDLDNNYKDKFKSEIEPNVVFNIEKMPSFLNGHPSIWSALYRREFLEKNKIKMVEESGGGWVDNPFFYETALSAESIIYVDEPVYYYRLSNPNSSSNTFNDYSIPMRRVLDMFQILEKYDCSNEDIIILFYNRLFRYIEIIFENISSINDLDLDVCLNIQKVLKKVDENIVKYKLINNFQKIYYKCISPLFIRRFYD